MPLNESVYRRKEKQEEERRKREQAAEMFTSGAQSSSNSNSGNSSTSSRNSSQTSQGGSQSPSAVDKLFHSTARKYSNPAATDTTRRNSRGQVVSGRDRTRSAVNSPKTTGTKIKEDTGEWAKNEAYGALTGFNKELASAADFLLPDVITPKKVQNVLDYYRNADEEQQQKVQASRGDSKLREVAGTIGGETLKNIPAAAMAILSGGTSVGAQVAGKAVPSLLEGAQIAKTGNIVQRAMSEVARTSGQNPMFWETFMRTVGPTYDNEIQNGADPIRATLSAYANALLNAQIEIGGGVEVYDPSEVFWKAAARSAKEEGLEEVQQYAVENLVNKAVGSNTSKWFSMNRGEDAVINPIDMAEQGFYGAAAGGLMSGGRTLGVNAVNSIRNDNYRNANPDIEERANELIQRASLQGREGEMATRAQNLAEEVSDQMARGKAPTAYQMRELERAVATDEYYNDKAYQESSQARYNQAVNEGRANTVESTGTADEYYGFQRGLTETEQRNYERAKAVMGEDASERSVVAVGRFMTGSENNSDIDTILLDPKAKSAVEELTDVTLPINNTKARAELENLALAHNIANSDRILEETHNEIRTNMSRRGGEFFDKNYDEAVATINEPNAANIYENFFSRFYTAGTVEGADFEKTYNRIISPLVEDFGEELGTKISQVFNHDFAQKVFAEGQIAMNSVRAKAQGKRLSVKASENPSGFTYEAEARKHISDKEAELFTKLAERAKVHIRLVSSIASGKANGSYDPETGVILIAADSDNKFITVFKHELTHHLKNTSPEMYQKLEDFVFKRWYDGDPEKMEERVQEYQKRYGFRPDEAREEIIADASEAFFTDQGAINDAVTFNDKMARAIHDGIKSLLDTFLDLVDTDRRADKGYGDFLKDLDILRDAEKMWLEALDESVGRSKGNTGSGTFVDNATGENVQFSLRTEAPPKKTRKGYKVFVVKNGELYPPMVANPNGEPTPVGVWLNADEGVRAGTSKTGRPQVKAGGKGTQGGSGTLAYRPGWHLGEMPLAQQFARKDSQGNKTLFPSNFVWAECDIAADNNYQEEAMSYGYTENGKFRHAYAGLPRIPKDGFYQYRTNPDPNTVPWLITGAMKINRILSDAEVRDILAEKGIEAPKRQGGDKTLEELGINNARYSLKDSEGNSLTEAQQEYFRNSKVRDKDGNLLVLYHGTDSAGFNVFSKDIGWGVTFLTSSRRTANAYGGNWENKLYDPNEKEQRIPITAGNYTEDYLLNAIPDMHFDTQSDLETFKKEHPGIEDIKSDYELEDLYDEDEISETEYERLRKLKKQVERDYSRYELSHSKVSTWQDILDNPDDFTFNDLRRAILAWDREAAINEGVENTKEDLLDAIRYFIEEDEAVRNPDEMSLRQMTFNSRVPVGKQSEYLRTTRNRTYETYVNLVNPLIVDAHGKAMSDGYYSYVDDVKNNDKYDGLIIKNVRIGAYGDESYVVISKEPNQVKLTSNENPTEDKDIRYSLKESDQAYMDAVNRGDMETAQRMVDEQAKKNGYEFRGYHGTKLPTLNEYYEPTEQTDYANKILPYTIFKAGLSGGIYVATNKAYPEIISKSFSGEKGTVMGLYVKLKNPLVVNEHVYDGVPKYYNIPTPSIMKKDGYTQDTLGTEEISHYAQDHGYDGVIIEGLLEGGAIYTDDYIAFSPNQLKLADPVTYDDNGNVIPLSKRFNENNEDIRYSIKDAPSMDNLDKSGAVLTKNNGDPIAKFEENGSVQFSIKTYDDNGRRIYKEYLDKMVKNRQLTKAEAKQMQDELETIYKITKNFADSGKYAPFTAWSNAEVVTGENGKPVFSAIKQNSEYKMNIDFSTICKKRRTLDNVFRVMVNRGLFEKLDLNKDESAALVVNINDLIREHGFEAACALCFVEARRYRQQQTATTFRDMWNGLVESMYKDKSKIEYFNYGENNEKKPIPDGIHTMSDKDLNLTRLKRLANAKNDEGKPLQTAEAKAARLLLRDPSQRKLMLVGDMMASTGFENMQVKNPELMKIYNAKKGTGGAKSSFGDVQYLNEILKPRSFGRMSAYAVSGVRIQSFSDYVPRMVFDYVQVIADLAAKRLPAHAYTKEVLFALQFGLTGAKINMSLVPDVVADGVAPGLDKNGNYVWNKEGTFPWEDYTDKNGRKMPGARTIQKAKGYKENCGTIAVGISDQQIWKMLLDPEIQMVIPYHKSSLNPLVAAMTNVDRFTDYTEYQNTRDKNGKAVEKEFDWDKKLFKLSHGKDNKLLPRSEWGDVQALVKEYVDWCNKHEYTPKFSQFLYMKDGSINPGYYKMLEDFALLDNDGTFKPQDDVKTSFPTDESAFGSMASLIEQGLDEDTKLEAKRSSEINGIVDEIEDMIKDGSITKQTISSQALADKMEDKFKYSLKSNGESRSYQSTITKLENQVKDLKSEFKRTNLKTADPKQVRIQAGKLITRHGSNMQAQKSLTDTFNEIFRLYKEKGTDAFDEVYEIAKNEAVNIVNNISVVHNEGEETYKAIKDYLRNTPITISEDMKRNITDFNDFRKRYFGKLKITNGNTTNIDTVYMELMELFPEQFTEDYVNPADQLYHMADVLDNYAPYYETLDGASEEMQDYVVDIASDIMETAYGLQTKKTFADKKYEEKVRAVKRAREKALASRDKAIARTEQRYERKIAALKQKNKDYRSDVRERGEKKRRIQQIANIHKRLSDMLFKGNDTKHLPEGYADTVARVLSLFDFTTKGMERWAEKNGKLSNRYKALKDLKDKLEQIGELEKNGIPSSIEFDERLVGGVRYLYNAFSDDLTNGNDRRLEDMTSEELTHIKRLFEAFEFQVKMENKTFDEENKRTRSEMAHSIFDDLNETKRGKWRLGVMGRLFTSNFNPSDFFTLVGGDIETLYNSTRKGFDKYVERLSNAKDFIQDNVTNKKADKWANHVKTYKTSSGEEIELTDSMLMSLYCLSKREQAQGHIYGGGIASAPTRVKKKMTTRELEKKRVIPSYQDLQRWFSDLTDEQIQVAEQIQKYFVDEVSEWGNETSLKLFNYRKFNEPNYFPIQSSKDYMASNFDERGTDPVLKNIGPSHQTVEGANNVIVVDDIFTVFSKHVAQMAAYNAYVPAITDFQRVWNYTEGNDQDMVKARFADVYGQKTADYIENFFKDLNGVYKRNFDVGLFDKGLGLFKKSAVGGNIRVLVQQPTAIARAALIINPAYLTAAIPTTTAHPKRTFKEMMDHCSIAKWKTWGFYSSDITSASRDLRNIMIGKDALTDKVFMDMYGVADNMTWTVIFKACELQVEAQNKGIKKGSDVYWEKVSALATRVFDRTQVVDSPFHRSEVMKSQDKGIKMVTAFMAEPTKTINMLNTELTMAARELANGHPARATGVFARVATVITANSALLAVAQALVDAARGAGGDDDEDKGNYVERLVNYWKKNFWDNMNPFAMIPYIKDVKSLWDGYDIARMDMNGVKKVIQAIQYLKKYYEDPENSKYTEAEEWENLALTAFYAAGVPLQNAKRDLEAIYLTAMEATGHSEVFFEQAKRKYQVNDKTKYIFADMYYDALERRDYRTADKIYSFLLRNGVTEEYIDGREKTWRKHKDEDEEG